MKKLEVMLNELPYAVEEALNKLRINIKFSSINTRKILLTSSFPNEGKSTVSVYLWKMLAEAGFPSVLVDGDMRKSVFKRRHVGEQLADAPGLTYYLSGLASYEDILYETNVENGYVVPVTNLLENPSHLLEDPRMDELLDRLAKDYRYVIIDSPPLQNVSDGSLMASKCDGAILVIRCGETPRREIRNSLQQINRSGCPLIGTVLNRAETRSGGYYYKYYSRYYSKYGYYYNYYYGTDDKK
jgi:capsular exopolysaccharide synthesis family protein